MKTAILTFHKAPNYGAMLQTYALQEFLQSEGHTVVVIDYWPYDTYALFRKTNKSKSFVKILREVLLLKIKQQRKRAFLSFVYKYLNIKSIDLDSLCDIDAFIIGSDQLWNSSIVCDSKYWGAFGAAKGKILISYAISAGNDSRQKKLWGEKYLNLFNAISVREESLQQYLNSIGINNTLVLDPTLLHDATFYRKVQSIPSCLPKPYILIYQIRRDELTYKLAQYLSETYSLTIVEIASDNILRYDKTLIKHATPTEFLWYFNNAEYIVTTSFHGVVFSIINHKNFFVADSHNNNDTRIASLLQRLNLIHHRVTSIEKFKIYNDDWERVEDILLKERHDSIAFLRKNLDVCI